MWLYNRRMFLMGAAALGGCGFTPVYGPQGAGNRLLNQIALNAPDTPNEYAFNRRFEERMGRATGPYSLTVRLQTDRQDLGTTSTGSITRKRVLGEARYTLRDAEGLELATGSTEAFTGYSTTGSTVATLAAQNDARERLMVLLADQVIDLLLLQANDLPA